MSEELTQEAFEAVAVVGLAGRFPGAANVEEFWRNLRAGTESISFFTEEELERAGVGPEVYNQPTYVRARGRLEGVEMFDAAFFGFNPREAEAMDPQHRVFLECAWEALESAGYDAERVTFPVGVFGGSNTSGYLLNLYSNPEVLRAVGGFQAMVGNDKDHLCTRVSYKLNLSGPSLSVQTACSTSLVAVSLACQSLLNYQCDMALAGGVSIALPQEAGYAYQEGGVTSPDGHCRAFDERALGTLGGNGAGVVVLKRLSEAIADGDQIHAVVRGTAVNNDGSVKVGYTAPSVGAQSEVIAMAQGVAGVSPDTISYVEAHGTGTPLGDPIEVAALTRAFRHATDGKNFCALGSVKTNVGHLDAAAGVAGLIKTVLALKNREIPPSLHFERPNPKLEIEESPFYVNSKLSAWERGRTPRRAGVSSFGIGGTNAHVVLEEAPETPASDASRPYQLLVLSARTPSALAAASSNLAAHLKANPDTNLADAAYTLQQGRKVFAHRRALVCRDAAEAVAALEAQAPKQSATEANDAEGVVFMFPGQGSQHVQMARELYDTERVFRETLDACADVLAPHLGEDLRRVIFPAAGEEEGAARRLSETALTQPAVFAVEYALAKLWMSWGVEPSAMIGHSVGEYVAACLAGVIRLEDALRLVAVRGRLMGALPRGAMTAVPLAAEELRPMLGAELSLAAHNGPALSVASGPVESVERLERQLAASGLEARRLHTSHAFHSSMVEPALAAFTEEVARTRLREPSIPFVSNVTGRWIEASEATDPAYWAKHLRQAVLFHEGVETLLAEGPRFMLEVGPGQTLTSLVRRHPSKPAPHLIAASLPHQQAESSAAAALVGALGKLWAAGVDVDWRGFYGTERRRRVQLPTYPFERSRYWVERKPFGSASLEEEAQRRRPVSEWFYAPTWKRDAGVRTPRTADDSRAAWLVLAGGRVLGEKVLNAIRRRGHEVVLANFGAGFARKAEGVYEIDARRGGDYVRLLDELSSRGFVPERVLHLGGAVASAGLESNAVEAFERAQGQVFYSLLYLAQALGGRRLERGVRLGVVTCEAQEVFGEQSPRPEQATVHGLCRVIPQEYPDISCRSIDVSLPAAGTRQEEELVDALVEELSRPSADAAVALRGGRRWAQTFEPTPIEAPPAGSARLRERGTYLITGGTGGVGLVFAEYLAREARARLVLTARTEFPPRSEWDARSAANDEVAGKIAKIRELEALGAEVLVCRADASDAVAMRAAFERAEAKFGPVSGVVHAAGVVGPRAFSLIQGTDEAACREQFAAKARGTLVLEEVLRGRARTPDFVMLVSSLSTVLGGVGFAAYASANAFMDAFAARQRERGGTLWTSVAWDGWRVGPAAEGATNAITPAEGLQALARLFSLEGGGTLAVSTADLRARIKQWVAREEKGRGTADEAGGASTFHPRPDLGNEYEAPRDEVEEEVASIWRELLGIKEVGIHDNFFELGGHSLLATHLIARLREIFHVEVPVRTLFETPTIVDLAGIVRQAAEAVREDVERTAHVLELIEFLSEEEARALLSKQ